MVAMMGTRPRRQGEEWDVSRATNGQRLTILHINILLRRHTQDTERSVASQRDRSIQRFAFGLRRRLATRT